MIGIASVNNLLLAYYLTTLIPLAGFALYDIKHHKIRNIALLLFLPWCLLSIPVSLIVNPVQSIMYIILKSLLGFLSGGLIFLCAALISKNGIGGGDIKLMALLGFIYSTHGATSIALFSSLSALLFALPYRMITKKENLHMAFAPFLWIGTLLYLLI